MDEILEGYRTFTALAAEVSTPGGSGIMSRYGSEPTDHNSAAMGSGTATAFSARAGDGTLGHYAPSQQPPRRVGEEGDGGGAASEALARQHNRRGRRGVPYIDPASDPVVMDALRLLFAKEGNYVQDLVRSCVRGTCGRGRRLGLSFSRRGNRLRPMTTETSDWKDRIARQAKPNRPFVLAVPLLVTRSSASKVDRGRPVCGVSHIVRVRYPGR